MVDHLIVPIDGSDSSWSAFDAAMNLARACNGHIDVVQVVTDASDDVAAHRMLRDRVAMRDTTGVEVSVSVERVSSDVVDGLAEFAERIPGSTFVMSSHGRGRSAAVLGSITEDLLRTTFGPIVVIGPSAQPTDFSGRIVVTVDGTDVSESAVPLAAAWAIELRSEVWIVEVLSPDLRLPPDVAETVYTSRLAHRMEALTGHDVQFEVLHGDPVTAVTGYASSRDVSLIVAATHGRSGAARFTLGSTAAGFVKHATCPVMLLRPPHLADDEPIGRTQALLG